MTTQDLALGSIVLLLIVVSFWRICHTPKCPRCQSHYGVEIDGDVGAVGVESEPAWVCRKCGVTF